MRSIYGSANIGPVITNSPWPPSLQPFIKSPKHLSVKEMSVELAAPVSLHNDRIVFSSGFTCGVNCSRGGGVLGVVRGARVGFVGFFVSGLFVTGLLTAKKQITIKLFARIKRLCSIL